MKEVSSFKKQNVSMQLYMKLVRGILAFIRSLNKIYLVETLTVVYYKPHP